MHKRIGYFSSRNNIPPSINQSNATDSHYRNNPRALPRAELYMPFRQCNYYFVEKRRVMTCYDRVNSSFKFNRIDRSYRQTMWTRHVVSLQIHAKKFMLQQAFLISQSRPGVLHLQLPFRCSRKKNSNA